MIEMYFRIINFIERNNCVNIFYVNKFLYIKKTADCSFDRYYILYSLWIRFSQTKCISIFTFMFSLPHHVFLSD